MNQTDFSKFSEMLDLVAEMYGKATKPNQVAMWFRILSAHSLESVQAAFDAHARDPERGRFMPLPADLLAKLEQAAANDGRPSPEEAWSTALQAQGEENTVVWTQETADAWWSVGSALMDAGDLFNASRGFIAKYGELVAAARKRAEPVRWSVCQGTDKNLRHQAIEAAYKSGRISREAAVQMLPRHAGDTGPIVAALASNVVPLLGGPRAVVTSDRAAAVSVAQRKLTDLLKTRNETRPTTISRDTSQSRRIVLAALDAGVIDGRDLDSWMTRAGNGEDVTELQARILEGRRHA